MLNEGEIGLSVAFWRLYYSVNAPASQNGLRAQKWRLILLDLHQCMRGERVEYVLVAIRRFHQLDRLVVKCDSSQIRCCRIARSLKVAVLMVFWDCL